MRSSHDGTRNEVGATATSRVRLRDVSSASCRAPEEGQHPGGQRRGQRTRSVDGDRTSSAGSPSHSPEVARHARTPRRRAGRRRDTSRRRAPGRASGRDAGRPVAMSVGPERQDAADRVIMGEHVHD